MLGRDWLGPGDGTWFEGDESHAHRCRNLSNHDMALTLHVYGGDLAQYFAYEQVQPTGQWIAHPQRSAIAGHLQNLICSTQHFNKEFHVSTGRHHRRRRCGGHVARRVA